MLFDQKYPVHQEAVFRDGTDRHTYTHTTHGHSDLETESAQRADAVKIRC